MGTVLYDIHGPDWPLSYIAPTIAGVPVRLMLAVDPTNINAPETPSQVGAYEYSTRFHEILFQGFRPNKIGGMLPNTGNVYIVRKGGNRDDPGTIVMVISPGQTITLTASPLVRDALSGYRYYVDADVDEEGVLITGLIF